MKRLRINPIRATWWGLALAVVVWTATASAEEPQARPGVVRNLLDQCFQITDNGDLSDDEIPCDDRYKEGEKIARWEFSPKASLRADNSPHARADWEAWQASAASRATTEEARLAAYEVEERKQAEQHADLCKPFLQPALCQPNDEKEINNKETLERGCKSDEITFQRNYWLALQGDHEAQERVASCFGNNVPQATSLSARWPCHRVVHADETIMCAWYLVAASSGHPKSSHAGEYYGFIYECDKKPERQTILGTASELFLRIYNRPLTTEAVEEARGYKVISVA